MNHSYLFKDLLARSLIPAISAGNRLGSRLQQLWAYARLKARYPELDASVVLLGMPELHGTAQIAFGKRLYLYRDLHMETQGDGRISIGNRVVISRGVHIVAHTRVCIGAGTMIGEYSSLRDANHRFGAGLELRESGFSSAPIEIGANVWIGRGVSVLAGVKIGDGAVIGANAVVTHSIAAGDVVAGVPAKALARSAA